MHCLPKQNKKTTWFTVHVWQITCGIKHCIKHVLRGGAHLNNYKHILNKYRIRLRYIDWHACVMIWQVMLHHLMLVTLCTARIKMVHAGERGKGWGASVLRKDWVEACVDLFAMMSNPPTAKHHTPTPSATIRGRSRLLALRCWVLPGTDC